MARNLHHLNKFLELSDLGILLNYLGKALFKCEQCGVNKKTDKYEYKSAIYIRDYIPKHWKALCKKCARRECGKRIFDKFTMGE